MKKAIEADEGSIFIAVEGRPERDRKAVGHRVLRVVVYDVTPEPGLPHGKGKREAMESLRVACHANALTYVRAELLEMGKRLDGAVVVT